MKNLLMLFFTISFFTFLSCDKTKTAVPTSGSASASINNVNWVANSVRGIYYLDSLIDISFYIQKMNEYNEPYPLECLTLRIRKISKYNIYIV